MLPLNDTEPNRYSRYPVMTIAIILANTFILYWLPGLLNIDRRDMYYWFGSIPAKIISREGAGALTVITSAFLHGGTAHLVSNMFGLWVFGRRVEDACGPMRYLLFYLTCAVTADIASTIVRFYSPIPSIGASGAVFGVMGAYLVLYPEGRIRTLILWFYVPIWPKIRAFWVVLYFILGQIIPAYMIWTLQIELYIGYWAHIGGFLGAIFILLFLRPEAFARYMSHADV